MSIHAAVDLGTNSVRVLLAKRDRDNLVRLHTYQKITRIGEELKNTGVLQNNAKRRTLNALKECSKLLERFQPVSVDAVATSAIRDAVDGAAFLKQIKDKIGLEFQVISGNEEARLSFIGAVGGLPGVIKNQAIVIDIGGGSTELSYLSNGAQVASSHQLGAVRCTEHCTSPVEMMQELGPTLAEIAAMGDKKVLVGVGGTVTTLVAIKKGLAQYDPDKVHGSKLSIDEIRWIFDHLALLPLPERKLVKGLQPERADIIIAGIRILMLIMDQLEVEEIIVSEADLLYGLIYRQTTI
ncbi:Ppx/GppA family phosphatase [Metallumcola ferriviriculae]|uniref:Ppx/GppA family phosphatase n=1 Tax=Metallumcola ferriviriculae TaxID=3039180 RepID=A0AAU0UJP7_9FIRM|nr:Ppx/GppA family phosphatase [Desulfitibacteraceae bacterium MK1]